MVLGIYGAGGLGKEVLLIAEQINRNHKRWEKFCYIVDEQYISDTKTGFHNVEIFTLNDALKKYENLEIIIGIGEPRVRDSLYLDLMKKNINIATLIHPNVYIDQSVVIGSGVVICKGCSITADVHIGNNVYIHPHAVIGHDIIIGDSCVIGANSEIGGKTVVGKRTFTGFLSGILDNKHIGDDVIISAGAIVFRDIENDVIVVGNPARIMKKNDGKTVFK